MKKKLFVMALLFVTAGAFYGVKAQGFGFPPPGGGGGECGVIQNVSDEVSCQAICEAAPAVGACFMSDYDSQSHVCYCAQGL